MQINLDGWQTKTKDIKKTDFLNFSIWSVKSVSEHSILPVIATEMVFFSEKNLFNMSMSSR